MGVSPKGDKVGIWIRDLTFEHLRLSGDGGKRITKRMNYKNPEIWNIE